VAGITKDDLQFSIKVGADTSKAKMDLGNLAKEATKLAPVIPVSAIGGGVKGLGASQLLAADAQASIARALAQESWEGAGGGAKGPGLSGTLGGIAKNIGPAAEGASGAAPGGIASSLGGIGGVAIGVAGGAAAIAIGAVVGGFNALAGTLHDIQGPLGIFDTFLKAIPLVGGPLSDIVTSLTSMVAKANPGAFMLWQRALEDVQGVIGGTFTPILQMMTQAMRFFGDTLATILPNAQEMSEALAPLRAELDALFAELRSSLSEFGPALREIVIGGIKVLASALIDLSRGIKAVLGPIGDLMRYLGLSSGVGHDNVRSSFGAAVQQVSMGGFDEHIRGSVQAAFQQSLGGGSSPEQQTADNTARIADTLDRMASLTPQGLAGSISRGAGVAAEAASSVWDTIRQYSHW
jgi:hypothetical protein